MEKYNLEAGITRITIVVIVVVLVGILIGAIAYFGSEIGVPQQVLTPTAQPVGRLKDMFTPNLAMKAQNGSNLNGQYSITIVGDPSGISRKTKVSLTFTNAPVGVAMPAHLHIGSCAGLGAVKYPLTAVVNGKSETTLDVSLLQLRLDLPLAINVHKSSQEAGVYVACADLNDDGSIDKLMSDPY